MLRLAAPTSMLLALALALAPQAPAQNFAGDTAALVLPDTARWTLCGGWKSGCEVLMVHGDPASGPSHLLVRLAPSAVIPRIRHASTEHFVVVRGRFVEEGPGGDRRVLGPGAHWYVPEGVAHGGLRCAGPERCMFYESHDRPLVTTEVGDDTAKAGGTSLAFTCGAGSGDAIPLRRTTAYTAARGYGFLTAPTSLAGEACTSEKAFFFGARLPEGSYDVTVELGHPTRATVATVKAEARRLMLEHVRTAPGQFVSRTFTVHVRTPRLPDGGEVRLNAREVGTFTWDDRLTLEFGGEHPSVRSIRIAPARNPITLHLAGNSTVTDQTTEPYASWGQMLPRFFEPGAVVVANHAESGETLKAFVAQNRLNKALSLMQPGDYLFIEFAHNDQKPGPNHLDPFTTYQETLRRYIRDARSRGATPVLVTPIHRRNFDEQGQIVNTLGDYPEAVRRTAREEGVPLIDLHAMSEIFYEALGVEGSKSSLVHYPAGTFPGQEQALADNTHHNAYGAYELAKMVVEGIRASDLFIERFLVDDVAPFDPARPDPVERWSLPASPPAPTVTQSAGS